MSKLFEEAIADAKKLKEVAEENAKKAILESVRIIPLKYCFVINVALLINVFRYQNKSYFRAHTITDLASLLMY